MAFTLGQTLQVIGAILALTLATIVLRVGRAHPAGRALAVLLFLEGVAQVVWCAQRGASPDLRPMLGVAGFMAFASVTFAYVLVLRHLPSPLTAPLKGRWAPLAALSLIPGPAIVNAVFYFLSGDRADVVTESFTSSKYLGFAISQSTVLLVGLYSLVAAISAYRRAGANVLARRQARAYAVAFAIRDLIFVIALGATIYLDRSAPERTPLIDPVWPLATILYVPLLAYGILQTHLFDLDLRVKLGISRATAASVVLAIVFVVAKVVEVYASRNLGFIAGAIAAGLLLFAAPRLNKLGDKVANTALPNVQPTSGYVQFKKLEVYRAAVESAQETGGIGERERASLDRLRGKLALDPTDCAAVEAEVVPSG